MTKKLTKTEKQELIKLLEEKERRANENKFKSYFPTKGPYSMDKYPKQMDFFRAGAKFKERAFVAANRSGKTISGAYEMVCHLTGDYPEWWEGRRFDHPISAWAAGSTNETTRDIIQLELLGRRGEYGTGMIPKHTIKRTTVRPGVPDAVQDVYIQHRSGGQSQLTFKSYVQGIDSFMGTARHVVWFDEEMDNPDIYSEALTRTTTTGGIIYCTFTPLKGLSDVVMNFLPGGRMPADGIPENEEGRKMNKYVVMASWEDVPHIPEEVKQQLLDSYSPHEKEARSKGIPSLGSGAIYPVPESEMVVEPFEIPWHWPKVCGFDVGWNKTAAVWGALDPASDVLYLYSEYYRGHAEPSIHADALKARGEWMPVIIDPAAYSAIANMKDGTRMADEYYKMGINIMIADNAVESGLLAVWQRLSSGRLKVFSSLQNWLAEVRVYRRNKEGKVVKKNDHLMDATRYLVMTGLEVAQTAPDEDSDNYDSGFSGRNETTGY